MAIRAVFFDLGGVILRTEFESPRQHLAERLNIEYDDLVRLVFDSETSRTASLGKLKASDHWAAVTRRLGRPLSEAPILRDEFFAGDLLDRELLGFIQSLKPARTTGLISNAWDDVRPYLVKEKCESAFDVIVISAEVGFLKPDPEIYRLALDQAHVKPNEGVMIDDQPANLEGCEKLGLRGVLFQDPESAIREIMTLLK